MIYKFLISNEANMSNFHPREVVGRGSETQLEVVDNLMPTAVTGVCLCTAVSDNGNTASIPNIRGIFKIIKNYCELSGYIYALR